MQKKISPVSHNPYMTFTGQVIPFFIEKVKFTVYLLCRTKILKIEGLTMAPALATAQSVGYYFGSPY